MGMYDTIIINCPKCKEPYYAQSKGGDCLLDNYIFPNVPRDVLSDINRHAPFICNKCGTKFFVDYKKRIIPKILLDWNKPFVQIINDREYEPELGQYAFGQPWQKLECPKLLEAALGMIDNELDRIMWNINQELYPSPFSNTGNSFKCYDVFEVEAYSWNDDIQPYNFKWKDVEISWYKYMGRGMSVNREVFSDEIKDLLGDCLSALGQYEKEFDKNFDIF